jgi:hypothetical protein
MSKEDFEMPNDTSESDKLDTNNLKTDIFTKFTIPF